MDVEVRYGSDGVALDTVEERTRRYFGQLVQDLDVKVPVQLHVKKVPAEDIFHKGRFDLLVNGTQARIRLQGTTVETEQDLIAAVELALFANRGLLAAMAYEVEDVSTGEGASGRSRVAQQLYVSCVQRGHGLRTARAIEERVAHSFGDMEDGDYVIETLMAAAGPRSVVVEVSRGLYDAVLTQEETVDGEVKRLQDMIEMMRDGLFYEIGVRFPTVEIELAEELGEHDFRIRLGEIRGPVAKGLPPGKLLVNDTVETLRQREVAGEATVNPANQNEAAIIDAADASKADSAGLTTWNTAGHLVLSLSAHLRSHAAEYLSMAQVEATLRNLDKAFPMIIFNALERYSLSTVADVLRYLVGEGVSIRDLRGIIEAMLGVQEATKVDFASKIVLPAPGVDLAPDLGSNPESRSRALSEAVRIAQRSAITHSATRGGGTLVVFLLSPDIEERLARHDIDPLSPELRRALHEAIEAEIDSNRIGSSPSIILTHALARTRLRDLISIEFPYVKVLSYNELDPHSSIQPIARIDWELADQTAEASGST